MIHSRHARNLFTVRRPQPLQTLLLAAVRRPQRQQVLLSAIRRRTQPRLSAVCRRIQPLLSAACRQIQTLPSAVCRRIQTLRQRFAAVRRRMQPLQLRRRPLRGRRWSASSCSCCDRFPAARPRGAWSCATGLPRRGQRMPDWSRSSAARRRHDQARGDRAQDAAAAAARGGRGGGLREKSCGRFRRGSIMALPAVGGRAERRGKESERPEYSEEETRSLVARVQLSRSSCRFSF